MAASRQRIWRQALRRLDSVQWQRCASIGPECARGGLPLEASFDAIADAARDGLFRSDRDRSAPSVSLVASLHAGSGGRRAGAVYRGAQRDRATAPAVTLLAAAPTFRASRRG